MTAYEKLGVFYLGKAFDPGVGRLREDMLLYDSKDLTTCSTTPRISPPMPSSSA